MAQYKRQLGGQLKQGFMWKYSYRPFKFAIYSLAVRLQRGGDIIDQERRKPTKGSLLESAAG